MIMDIGGYSNPDGPTDGNPDGIQLESLGSVINGRSQIDNGVTYCWKDLSVFVKKKSFLSRKTTETQILHNISGICKPGQFLAVMGASGAGKTTLLNVLTYRSMNMRITGDILINGQKVDTSTLMGTSAYVQQEDLFSKVFTVREQLEFSAQLRIGKKISTEERKKRISEVMKELGLNKCADTLIGDPGRVKGISGGEKKRLAFACEMITNPFLLFCDEPTSGLDSFMAQSVTTIMKNMTRLGKTVISTIHQPSSEVFMMFDQLLLLAEGRVAFHGSVSEALAFFSRIKYPCPDVFNPSDHFIYTLAIQGGKEEECRAFVHETCDSFRDNEGIAKDDEIKAAMLPPTSNDVLSKVPLSKSPYRASYSNQFSAVLRRAVYDVTRSPLLITIKLGQTIFFAIVFGLIYFHQDTTNQKEIMNISAAMFLFITNISFSNLFPVVTTFAGEMPLLLREHWNGMYRTDIYFITKSLVELPISLLIPILYNSITYYMVGFRDGISHFLIATLIYILITTTAISYGYMISCLSSDYNMALTISTPLTFPLVLFAGFYVSEGSIPPYLEWIKYLSWFNYGYQALMVNQWKDFNVTKSGVDIPVGNYILDSFGFDADKLPAFLIGLLILAIGYRCLALFFLLMKARRKKQM